MIIFYGKYDYSYIENKKISNMMARRLELPCRKSGNETMISCKRLQRKEPSR